MRRLLSFVFILLLSVLCSACVNSFAVKELNRAAIEYMEKGDMQNAISRLESSIDLDDSIYETRYNLAVCYIKSNQCEKALEQIKAAKELSPKEPTIYYSAGVANNCMADNSEQNSEQYALDAIENYEKYLELAPNAPDKDSVETQIQILKEKKTNDIIPD